MEAIQIVTSESGQVEVEVRNTVNQVKALVITDPETYVKAADFRSQLLEKEKLWHGKLKPLCETTDKAHKAATSLYGVIITDGFKALAKSIKEKMIAWDQEQKEIARKKALELEAKEKRRAEDEQLEVAELMESVGAKEEAEQLLKKPVEVTPVKVETGVPNVGLKYRGSWKFRVIDPNLVPRAYLMLDEKKIGGVVRHMKDATNIPGIRAYEEKI